MPRLPEQASVHPETVTKVSKGEVKPPRRKRGKDKAKRTKTTIKQQHPAYLWARARGIDPARVEVTAEPPLWGCIIHNQPIATSKE